MVAKRESRIRWTSSAAVMKLDSFYPLPFHFSLPRRQGETSTKKCEKAFSMPVYLRQWLIGRFV